MQRMLDSISGRTLDVSETCQPIIRSLEFDILFGRLKPRERLTEDALMDRFSAKRHVIRNVLLQLERNGIVVRTPNRGASVRELSLQEVQEITELRETLHRRAVQRMQVPASPALVRQLKKLQRAHDRAVRAQNPEAIDAANEAFHQTFFGACGNQLPYEAIMNYAYLSRIMRLYPMVDPVVLETLRSEHWAMIAALEEGDRRTLARLVGAHIEHSKRMYLRAHAQLLQQCD